jgi:hypothetical protein
MKQKLKNKDDILECNLSTVLGAVRGSTGYWNRVRGDLIVMDENLNSAIFLLHLLLRNMVGLIFTNF